MILISSPLTYSLWSLLMIWTTFPTPSFSPLIWMSSFMTEGGGILIFTLYSVSICLTRSLWGPQMKAWYFFEILIFSEACLDCLSEIKRISWTAFSIPSRVPVMLTVLESSFGRGILILVAVDCRKSQVSIKKNFSPTPNPDTYLKDWQSGRMWSTAFPTT
jgi:hypothetical protein